MVTRWTSFPEDTLMPPCQATVQRQRARIHRLGGGPVTNPLSITAVIN